MDRLTVAGSDKERAVFKYALSRNFLTCESGWAVECGEEEKEDAECTGQPLPQLFIRIEEVRAAPLHVKRLVPPEPL